MTVHLYCTNLGENLILEYIDSLSNEERIDAFSVLDCMEKAEFEKLVYKRLENHIYEVYFRKHNRMFLVILDGEDIYLLHICRKEKYQIERKDKKIALRRTKELEQFLEKKFV